MKNKVCGYDEVARLFHDGMRMMCGGFLGSCAPKKLIDCLLDLGIRDITMISNDTWVPERGVGKLVAEGRISRLIVAHIGTNPISGQRMVRGDMQVELVPMGTLVERIRAGGAGLGGVLTPTGMGTDIAAGKRTIEVDGAQYLLETPLRAQFSLLGATRADTFGNAFYHGTGRNMNVCMALAGDIVIVEADEIVPPGALDPDIVGTPGVLVDHIVKGAGA